MDNSKKQSRREFIKSMGMASAGVMLGSLGLSHRSYANILGSNDRVNIAFVGVGVRGAQMSRTFSGVPNAHIAYVCDPDTRSSEKCMSRLSSMLDYTPTVLKDFRKALDDKNLDAIFVAAPDHWHAPAGIMAAQAGKHSYIEKPISHSPAEGEWLSEAMNKYGVLIQAGTQRRSFPFLQNVMRMLHEGEIGNVYIAKGWYTNNRKGTWLKESGIPSQLDYELWQGPAPRVPYKEGIIPYDWHWFWNWGTGEALNNGSHELDLMVWGTQAAFPEKVTSVGGRYAFEDDWQTPDTQIITWQTGNCSYFWEGRSANDTRVEGEGRGVIFYGTKGSVETGNLFYRMYDSAGKLISEESVADPIAAGKKAPSPNTKFDPLHAANFVEAIRGKVKLNCPADVGHRSNTWVQLGNIAQRSGQTLLCDPTTGHILNSPEASKLWYRDYEPGWNPKQYI